MPHFELTKPSVTVYADGSEIAFRLTSFTGRVPKSLHDVLVNLSHRRWDASLKQWFIYPQSYYQFIGGLQALDYQVIADPSCKELLEKYQANIASRLALKELKVVELNLNSDFKGVLYPFQTVGANFMYRSKRAILGDPVGLGKTPMAIAASLLTLKEGKVDFVIIVVPANLRSKWIAELDKFLNMNAIEIKETKAKRVSTYQWLFTSKNIRYAVLSYSALSVDLEEIMHSLREGKVKYCAIFDEIQACKRRKSQRSNAARVLADEAQHVYGISATYIEGRLEELYNVFRVARDKVLGTSASFWNTYIQENVWGGRPTYKNLDLLRTTIDPYVIRRLVEDVGVQMPKEVYQEYMITLTPVQQGLYASLVAQDLREWNELTDYPTHLVEMLRERECCLSTELIDPNTHESPKLEVLKEIIESLEPDAKVVVFCFFSQRAPMVDILERELGAFGREQDPPFNVLKIKGGMTDKEMVRIRKQFDEDPKAKILVTSDVSKEGHDLVAARHIVHFDLLWNPAAMKQRAGRIIRITQKASQVVIHTLITRGTVEEYMWDVVYQKGEVMKTVQDAGREEGRITRKAAIEILENYRG